MAPPIFVFGAPRSGTTWLQRLLGAHPAIATPQELHLFSGYLAGWPRLWDEQLPASEDLWRRNRYNGLPAIMTRAEFDAFARDLVDSVHRRVLAAKPGATIVLEKDAGYQHVLPLIVRLFPEARLIHVIRDGRDVAASLLRASAGWGREWASRTASHAGWAWRSNVEAGRTGAALTGHYREVRYEDLGSPAGPQLLHGLLAFVGAECTAAEAAEIHARFALVDDEGARPESIVWGGEVRARIGERPLEPEGFYGGATPGSWRDGFDAFDRWSFALEAGALLGELGYEDDASWVQPGAWALLGRSRRSLTASVVGLRFALGAGRRALRARPAAWLAR
ncbi:MAG TPA: sulfotransferase [Gaiellaceae bacterium]|nr:sulfotransferase [Gaiellaceae bacterium]